MYLMKDNDMIKVINQSAMARVVGLTPATINRIFNQKQMCSKLVAYCITKFLDHEKNIEDLFIKIDTKGE